MSPVNNKKITHTTLGIIPKLVPCILAVALWIFLTAFDGQILKKTENLSLFLYDSGFLKESLSIPGGFIGWAGAFFTQFLYTPWLGSLIWVLLLLLSARLTVKAFRIPDRFAALAYIPAVALIILNLSMGYGIFIMRKHDYFFSPVLGYIVTLVPLFTDKHLSSSWKLFMFRIVWITIGFMLFGTYALTGALAALIARIRNEKTVISIITALLIILTPLVFYNFYTTYRLADSLYLGLPQPSLNAWKARIYTPLFIVLAYPPLMALFPFKKADEQDLQYKSFFFNLSLYIIFVVAVCIMNYGELTFRTEIAMSNAIDELNWQKAVNIFNDVAKSRTKADARTYKSRSAKLKGVTDWDLRDKIVDEYADKFYEPTKLMVLYRDLALIKLDKALDEAFTMKDGVHKPGSKTIVPMAVQAGNQLYLHYGIENTCYRWCIENSVEYGISVNTLKYLAMYAIATSEWDMAGKYLDQLDKTLFHRKWTASQRALIANPDKIDFTAPYDHIRKLMCADERMINDKAQAEIFLLTYFYLPRPKNATPEYDKTALFWAMRSINDQQFWKCLSYYTKSNHVKTLPKHVQEATLLFNAFREEKYDLPVDQKTVDTFKAFDKYLKQNPVYYLKESRYPYSLRFGHTYYYFYYFNRDVTTY